MALRPAASLGGRLADPRFHELLGFQPIERGVDGADRDLAADAVLDLLADGDAVRVLARTPQPQERQQDDVLELAKGVAAGHLIYKLEQIAWRVNGAPAPSLPPAPRAPRRACPGRRDTVSTSPRARPGMCPSPCSTRPPRRRTARGRERRASRLRPQ